MSSDPIGDIRREFKPGMENLVAGIIIGLLLVGGGCAAVYFPTRGVIDSGGDLPAWTDKGQSGWSWGAAGILAALGIGAILGGVFLIRWIRSLFSFRVRVGRHGLGVADRSGGRVIRWDDIVSVEEVHLSERPPVLKGVAKYALPKVVSKSYVLALRAGEPFGFDGNTVKGHNQLAQLIREETGPRDVPWQIREEHA